MQKLLLACALLALSALSSHAADNAWVGTWKLDIAKSHFTGDTFTYTQAANGLMHYSNGSDVNFDFGIDGKEYMSAYGRSVIWTAAGDNAWNTVVMFNGNVFSKVHRQISPDGKTYTITMERTRPDGSAYSEEDVYVRETGTTGLVGKWRSTKVTLSAPDTCVISSPAPAIIRMEYPEFKSSVEGKTDGTDNAYTGPLVPTGMTVSFKMLSPSELSYTYKFDGKPRLYGTQTLSADGKILTDVSWNPGKENEKSTGVYIKQ
jgi:hypothetical protein